MGWSRVRAACAGLVAAGLFGATAAPTGATPVAEASSGPRQLRVTVLASYPHDPTAFTQGLELRGGLLYEGTGRYGQSDLRTVEPATGKVRRRVALPEAVFGEGITVVGERIWQITYTEGLAFLRDRRTLAEIRRVSYTGEGWGLCHDATRDRLVMSDGTPTLTFRDARTFEPLGSVTVTHNGTPLRSINELECARGSVWANVWLTDQIVRIDPATGVVDAVVDAAGLLSDAESAYADVLNGIAAVPRTDAFYLTGKLWPRTFLVRFTDPT